MKDIAHHLHWSGPHISYQRRPLAHNLNPGPLRRLGYRDSDGAEPESHCVLL